MKFGIFLSLLMMTLGFGANAEPGDRSATEGRPCIECDKARNPEMERLQGRITELEKAWKEKGPAQPVVDTAAAERQKDRMLKKIKNMDCPKQGGGEDSMFGDDEPEDMFAQIKSSIGGGGGRGGPGGPGPGRAGGGSDSGNGPQTQLTAEMREEVEDAMDDKMTKCKKQAQRQSQRSMMSGNQNGAGNMNGMNSNSMGGILPMLTSLMGGGSNMQGAGMNRMGMGMNSMMSMNSMMNPYMNSMMSSGSMGGMNNMNSMMMNPYLNMNNSGSSYYMPLYMQLMQANSPSAGIRSSGLGI